MAERWHQSPWVWGGAVAGGVLGALVGLVARPRIRYPVDPTALYGPRWGRRRPPGLPGSARLASARGAAASHVRAEAKRRRLGPAFVRTVAGLAHNESGATFALPAARFDARCGRPRNACGCVPIDGERTGQDPITAWGVFNYNCAAWRYLRGRVEFPWDVDAHTEIAAPIGQYAAIWREIRALGHGVEAAARGVRLFHRSPAAHRQYVADLREMGASRAWARVEADHRIDIGEDLV